MRPGGLFLDIVRYISIYSTSFILYVFTKYLPETSNGNQEISTKNIYQKQVMEIKKYRQKTTGEP